MQQLTKMGVRWVGISGRMKRKLCCPSFCANRNDRIQLAMLTVPAFVFAFAFSLAVFAIFTCHLSRHWQVQGLHNARAVYDSITKPKVKIRQKAHVPFFPFPLPFPLSLPSPHCVVAQAIRNHVSCLELGAGKKNSLWGLGTTMTCTKKFSLQGGYHKVDPANLGIIRV